MATPPNSHAPRHGTVLVALILFGLLLLTNRYAAMPRDAGLVQRCCTDAVAYVGMARAFPQLPDEQPPTMRFHHAQRFALPWIAGGLARITPLSIDGSFRALTIGLALGVILLTLVLLRQVGASSATQSGMLALFVFNAYAFRFNLAFPWYVADTGFVFGLVLTLTGLMRGNTGVLLAGLLIAAVSRQTALLILPAILAWLAFVDDWSSKRIRVPLMVACLALVVGVYHATGRVAASFATGNTNIEKLSGIFTWVAHDFSTGTLLEFVARMFLPALPVLLIGVALAVRHHTSLRTDLRFWLLVSMSAAIVAQPALAGPGVIGGNAPRLVMLGFVPLLVALAHVMSFNRFELPATPRFWAIFGTGAFLSSLHHIYSFLARDDSLFAARFALVFTVASLLMAGTVWAGWRSGVRQA